MARAHAHSELGHQRVATREIARVVRFAESMGSRNLRFAAGLLQADIWFACGSSKKAAGALARVMRLGREQGYLTSSYGPPRIMARLSVEALRFGHRSGLRAHSDSGARARAGVGAPRRAGLALAAQDTQSWLFP